MLYSGFLKSVEGINKYLKYDLDFFRMVLILFQVFPFPFRCFLRGWVIPGGQYISRMRRRKATNHLLPADYMFINVRLENLKLNI